MADLLKTSDEEEKDKDPNHGGLGLPPKPMTKKEQKAWAKAKAKAKAKALKEAAKVSNKKAKAAQKAEKKANAKLEAEKKKLQRWMKDHPEDPLVAAFGKTKTLRGTLKVEQKNALIAVEEAFWWSECLHIRGERTFIREQEDCS